MNNYRRSDREYEICQAIARYMKYCYPNVIYHFDYAGLNLSKTQSGKMKAIQGKRGWPDMFIARMKTEETETMELKVYLGLFIEIKKEGTVLWKTKGGPATDHIKEQIDCLNELTEAGYMAEFGIGLDGCKKLIDGYLS